MMAVFALFVIIWQLSENGPSAMFFALILITVAACIRIWRSWPSLRLDSDSNPQVLYARNWLKVHSFSVDSSSTMHFRASRLMSEPTRRFELRSDGVTFRSRVHLSGEEGFAEAEELATAWAKAGGNLVDESASISQSREARRVSNQRSVNVTLPADVNQIDETGNVWAFLSDAAEPARVSPGSIIVAGDSQEPFLARVVDVVDGPGGDSVVHLDVLGVPDQTIDELRHAGLLPT